MHARAAATATSARPRAPYENWRPPLLGVCLVVPVEGGGLLMAELHGALMLPVGPMTEEQTPEQVANVVLQGTAHGLPGLRCVVVDEAQMRRRKVTVCVLITDPLTRAEARHLTYRDPRAYLRIIPTEEAIAALPEQGRPRAELALQAPAVGPVARLVRGLPAVLRPRSAALLRRPPTALRGTVMTADMWANIARIAKWFKEENPGLDEMHFQSLLVHKLTEEVGEVAEALIGVTAFNPRKGKTHTIDDVKKELCDVIATAAVNLWAIDANAADTYTSHLQRIAERADGRIAQPS